MKVDINLLKELRALTFAPLNDCKEALVEAEGDIEQAQEILRKKGALKAAKKSDRETKEGLVKAIVDGDRVYAIKLACETDFVAKNDDFRALLDVVLNILKKYDKDVDSIDEMDKTFIETEINPILQESVGKIGENIRLADVFIKTGSAYVYAHPGDKVLSIIFFVGEEHDVSKELALQVAAMNPMFLNVDDVSQEIKDNMMEEFKKELEGSGKPVDIIDKIIEGKSNKAYGEIVLMEQLYIRDETKKIKDIIPQGYEILGYKRFSI